MSRPPTNNPLPFPEVLHDAGIQVLEHLQVFLLSKHHVRLHEVLVERVHARSNATHASSPLATVDIDLVT